MSFGDYYRLVATRLKPGVETFTGANWDLPAYGEIEETFQDHELFPFGRFPSVELYRYLVYLRHHGFPSPLLDWSQSPYVAAFFAFRDSPPEGPEKRSIYAYCETQTGIRGGAVGEPMIRAIGPYVRSHRRHFRQQSNYTICGRFDSTWLFHNHEKVFSSPRPEQDRLWKFDLPSLERSSVLQSLDEYNLNAFSLFDTDESLMETMWLREQTFRI